MSEMLRRFDLQLFADDGGDGGAEPQEPTGGDQGQGKGDTEPSSGGKTFTQAELDAIIAKRLSRERKAWEQQLEEERKKAAMTEAERLKAEKEEAEKRANELVQAANRRIIAAEAKVAAAAAGVKPERISYVLKLADLSDIEADENGNVDSKAIAAAINAVLKDLPELKGDIMPPKGGDDFSKGQTKKNQLNMNDFIRRAAGR